MQFDWWTRRHDLSHSKSPVSGLQVQRVINVLNWGWPKSTETMCVYICIFKFILMVPYYPKIHFSSVFQQWCLRKVLSVFLLTVLSKPKIRLSSVGGCKQKANYAACCTVSDLSPCPPHWVSVFRSCWLWFDKNVNLVCCHSYQGGGACKCLWCHGSLCGVNMHSPTTECLSGKVVNWFAHVFCWGLFLFVLNRAN